MEKKLKKPLKSEFKIVLCILIAIITIVSFVCYGGSKTEKQIMVAKKIEVRAGQTAEYKETKENNDTPTSEDKPPYYNDEYWEWHTRVTTDDKAYNGNHIKITDSIKFYGYWKNSYKDFLYKEYSYAGEKTFAFILDETRADYHTLDGAGFIFNAKQENGKLSGYAILVNKTSIELYRMDNIDIATFEVTGNATMRTYAGEPIATVDKKGVQLHEFVIKTSPTNVTVVDNKQEMLNVNLDYSKHSGESFGLIASYAQHSCTSLTQIEFSELSLDIDNYVIPVLKVNEEDEPLQEAEFQVKNEEGEVVRKGITNEDGIFAIEGLPQGIYTLEETKAPSTYAYKVKSYKFKITDNGKAVDIETGEEITLKIVNEALKFEVTDYIVDTEKPISGIKIQLYDENGKEVLGKDGKPIVAITNGEGKATFTGIEAGTYTYKQIEVPDGYIINNSTNKVMIENDGKVTYVQDENGNGKDGIIYNEIKKNEEITKPGDSDSSDNEDKKTNDGNTIGGNNNSSEKGSSSGDGNSSGDDSSSRNGSSSGNNNSTTNNNKNNGNSVNGSSNYSSINSNKTVNSVKGSQEDVKQGILPKTGSTKGIFIVMGIFTLIVSAVYCAIRYKKIH